MDRFAQYLDVDYYEMIRFTEEIESLPPVVFRPGFIGGHCVMPNIDLLVSVKDSVFLGAVKWSNEMKSRELIRKGEEPNEGPTPVAPIPLREETTLCPQRKSRS